MAMHQEPRKTNPRRQGKTVTGEQGVTQEPIAPDKEDDADSVASDPDRPAAAGPVAPHHGD